jgi:AraC-like DNA-binding protein
MKTSLTTDDLAEIIYQHEYPQNFAANCGLSERRIEATHKGTQARIQEFHFDGVMIQNGTYTFQDDMTISGGFDRPILEMHFNLKGRSGGQVTGFKEELFINGNEHALTYMPEPTGRFHFEAGTEMEALEISFTPQYFERFRNQECRIIDRFMEAMEKQHPLRMPNNGKIDPLMKNIIQQMAQNPFKGSVKRLYVESKVLELFATQLESFENQEGNCDCNQTSHHDREKIYHAKKLLEDRLHNPPTIYELSRLVGLNEFKLKKGFKATFGNTIFGYLSEYRLGFARQFLLDTDKPIADISDMIGYSQQQHFSTAFKRRYGVTPSEVRK